MKAVQIQEQGGIDVLKVVDIPKPEPKEGQLLVRMTHAAINPGDLDVAAGALPFAAGPPLVLGMEGSGVVEVGNDEFPEGTRVIVFGGMIGVVNDGTWAEYISVAPSSLSKMPPGLTSPEAAVLSLVHLTAAAAMYTAGFKSNKPTLITTMGGGVGNAAYQIALFGGATPLIGTVGSPEKKYDAQKFVDKLFRRPITWEAVLGRQITTEKLNQMRETYRENILDLSSEDLEARVNQITEGAGLAYIIDTLSGDYLPRFMNMAAPGGIVMTVGYKAGMTAEINVMPLLAKQLQFLGTNVFNLPPEVQDEARKRVYHLISHGLRPVIAKRFSLDDVQAANKYASEERPFGKVLLNIEE